MRPGHSSRSRVMRTVIVLFVATSAVSCMRVRSEAVAERQGAARGPNISRAMGYYDATLRRVVLIGGTGQARAGVRDSMWSFTGTAWEPMSGSASTSRGNASAAYDARRRLAVVSGGMRQKADSTFEIVSDTWEGAATGWRAITGSEFAPRDHHAMMFDSQRGSVLLYGGMPGSRSAPWPTDTWELRADGWRRIAFEGPAGRARTAMVYDERRGQVVLFGGVGESPGPQQPQPFFSDTWIWERNTWRKAADGGPRGRYAHGMVFDERAGVVLLYSGAAAHRDAPLTDMWQWDGTRWMEIPLSGATPGYRYQSVMVYDRARERTVLYGGLNGKNDTWEWDGRSWKQVLP